MSGISRVGHASVSGRRVSFWVAVSLSIGFACIWVSWPILRSPNTFYPSGIDTMGHLAKVAQVALRWRALQFCDWFPEWYMGATAVQYYPPLSVWIGAGLQVLFENIMITYKILVVGSLFLGGLAVARLMRFLGGGFPACVVAPILYATGGYTLFTVFIDGTFGRMVCLPLYPLLLQALIEWCERPTPSRWLWCCMLVSLIVLAHAMHAYLLFTAIAVYVLVWCLRYRDCFVKLLGLVEIAVVGVAITMFWVVPGVTQLENPGVPWSPPEMAGIRSVGLSVLLSPQSVQGSTVMFVAAVAGASILAAQRKDANKALALLTSLAFTTSLVYGPRNPLYNFLPMNKSLAPLRFINAAFLPAALGAGLFADICAESLSKKVGSIPKTVVSTLVALAVIVLAFCANARPSLPPPRDFAALQSLVAEVPKGGPGMFDSGRLAEELPMIGGEATFFPARGGLAITAGWNIEGTSHMYTLYNHNLAYSEDYPDYILRNWRLWNARSALIDVKYQSMIATAILDGWQVVDRRAIEGGYRAALLTDPTPSTYFMIPNHDVLVIGRSSFFVARLFPWVTEGREPNPLKYDENYLDLFKCIYLYDLPPIDAEALEKKILGWVEKGKKVIVDLSVSDSIPGLLGVTHLERENEGFLDIRVTESGKPVYDTSERLYVKRGRGAVYDRLDRVLLTVEGHDGALPICGIRELQDGEVYFVGGHIPRLTLPEHREAAKRVLEPLLDICRPSKTTKPLPFRVTNVVWTHKGVTFTAESPSPTPVLVSVTYTPRWHCSVDGVSQRLYRHENLVLINLPSGSHTVRLEYGGTPATRLGWILTGFTAVYICARLTVRNKLRQSLLLVVRRFRRGYTCASHV